MKWSILILTMAERRDLLYRLQQCLYPQIENYKDIEILVRVFRCGTIGENRQALLNQAQGEYVCFIDDDDMVPAKYVEKIYPLLDGVDYIGFSVHTFRDGTFYASAYHSLKHGRWSNEKAYAERDISHLNPIRRELALQAPMEGGAGEDRRWADRLRDLNIVRTQHYIPEVMYFYYIRTYKPEFGPKCALVS